MRIARYFWDLNGAALRETERVLKNPKHPLFGRRMIALLSRCDQPRELFSILPKREFLEAWPTIRTQWLKRVRRSDSRDWWETLYEEMVRADPRGPIPVRGETPDFFRRLGATVKEARFEKGLSQRQLALRVGMRQPDISRIEEGKKNVTLFTLTRLCRVLGIKKIEIA